MCPGGGGGGVFKFFLTGTGFSAGVPSYGENPASSSVLLFGPGGGGGCGMPAFWLSSSFGGKIPFL